MEPNIQDFVREEKKRLTCRKQRRVLIFCNSIQTLKRSRQRREFEPRKRRQSLFVSRSSLGSSKFTSRNCFFPLLHCARFLIVHGRSGTPVFILQQISPLVTTKSLAWVYPQGKSAGNCQFLNGLCFGMHSNQCPYRMLYFLLHSLGSSKCSFSPTLFSLCASFFFRFFCQVR